MAAPRTSAKRATIPGLSWEEARLAPVVLVQGSEGLLVDRAVDRLTQLARAEDPAMEKTEILAAGYQSGMLSVLTSPSLFAEPRLVVIDGAEATTEALITDIIEYLRSPAEEVWLVVAHRGGVRGKKMLDAIRASGAPAVACEPIKKDTDKVAFAAAEFKRGGRRASVGAVRALVEAVGSDLRELAAACSQLMADSERAIDEPAVTKYYGGRVEATGFRVADAAIAGDAGQAVSLLRHALATGADPVPVVAALAMKLRTLAKVAALRGRGLTPADLGLAPWQVDRARKDLANWTPEGLATAITATAAADAEVKGAGRDPVFAVERAVLLVAASAGR
ncbi:DNA polymerase III, delta subunit [Sanguibacter gelidistatuariae]|uniref:DNA-directed DNA polymerase n=1 Tax=Sanguibacter gelidistatuariae TaxID=1814289 RepID=A0A1G6RX48_9MICO|nr:DNA polymerase III subunit delta [Sanguibacter gelidistatuariae]SDD09138.1 DNA polymerase III, delta subunit [Sanguibacter gelidistatuariae]